MQYLGVAGLARELGVTRQVVSNWRARYPSDSAHPFPLHDVEIDGLPGWAPDRVAEVQRWRDGMPGRGAGGGRPRTSAE